MKKSCSTIYRFEMGDIILLDPYSVNHSLYTILKAEKKDILRMRVTDRETE
jgi:hypothetical protein